MSRFQRRHDRPDRKAVLGSIGVHLVAALLVALTVFLKPVPRTFLVYEMDIVSPDALELGDLTPPTPEEFVVETPDEILPDPVEETPPVVIEEDAPVDDPPPEPEEQAEEEQAEPVTDPEDPVEEPVVATSPDPDPDVEDPGEDINVRMQGLQRDYPVYYENIVRQMRRCFRPPQGSTRRATIEFSIARDGSVSGIQVVEQSGDFAFDLIAMGAAECAGNGRFGPLPEGMSIDHLPIQFKLDPSGTGELRNPWSDTANEA
jgi:outer membrane biosynthesis protein TonB